MKTAFNPFGLHTITPYLIVDDVKKLIDFLQNVFDAIPQGKISYREDSSVQHAEIKIGDSMIMMGAPSTKFPTIETTKCGMYIYVEDCDKTYEKALNLGARSISEPMNYPHGDRFSGIQDFAGNTWWIVTHIGTS